MSESTYISLSNIKNDTSLLKSTLENSLFFVPPSGSIDSEIALIGEAPASQEIKENRPFAGTAGHFLDKVLSLSRLSRNELYITNLSKEPAPMHKMQNMSISRIAEWKEYLIDEINSIHAKILMPLGNYALEAITGRTGISQFRGSIMHPRNEIRQNCIVIPTLHPAMMCYHYDCWPYVVADLSKARQILQNNFDTFQFPRYNFEIKPSFEKVLDRLEWLYENRFLRMTIDIETPHNILSCIGIGWSHSDAICIPFIYGNRKDYFTQNEEMHIWQKLAQILPKLDLNNQNFMFDWEILRQYGIYLSIPKYDPMLMHHCLYSELSHKLNDIISIYTNMEYYKSDEREESSEKALKGSVLLAGREMEHWRYNCLDCVGALWCIDELEQELVEENMMQVYQNLYQNVFEPYLEMNINGIRIDIDKLKEYQISLNQKIEELQADLDKVAGYKINPASPKQVKEFLVDHLGMTGYHKRGSTSYTMDEEHLEKMAQKYNSIIPKQIIEFRKITKELSLFSEENVSNNRIHCRYSLGRSATGRITSLKSISGRGMNLQNVKRGNARMFFVVDNE